MGPDNNSTSFIEKLYLDYVNQNGLTVKDYYIWYDPKSRTHSIRAVEKDPSVKNKLKPHHVLVNGDTTTVVWKDGTHTIVKKAEGDNYDIEKAILWAIIKKAAGNNASFTGKYIKEFTDLVVVQPKKKKKKKPNANDITDAIGRSASTRRERLYSIRSQLDGAKVDLFGEEGKQE